MTHETDQERVRTALSFLDYNDEDVWIKAAMCLKSEYGDAGFDIWEDWGSQFARYAPKVARSRWKSIKAGGKVTIGSLFYDAKAAGWKDDKKYEKPSREVIEQRKAAAAKRQAEADAQEAKDRAAAAQHARFMWDSAQPLEGDDHPYLKRKGVISHGLRVGTWEKIDHENGTVDVISNQALLIPIRDAKKNIHSLQAIFAGKAMGDRDKDFVTDGAKSGNFYSFGKPVVVDVQGEQRQVIMVGEGYATLASAHAATGHACIVAFDAGNVPKVARVLRERFPDAALLFLADNDRHTENNPGVKKAREAAAEVGGFVAIPHFDAEHKDATDFNDLHQLRGLDAVREVIEAALAGAAADDTPPWEEAADPASPPLAPAPLPAARQQEPEALTVSDVAVLADEVGDPEDDTMGDENPFVNNRHFRTLGVDGGTYYFFKKGKRNQILEYSTGGLTTNALLSLAPLNWWEGQMLDSKDGKFKKEAAVDFLMQAAEQVGIFDPTFTRGRGAWFDQGRLVIHIGDKLLVDGQQCGLGDIDSEFLYQGGRRIAAPSRVALTIDEGKWLLEVASMFRWGRPASGLLLCGWMLLSPLCGALRWRPHAWITGGAGSGKSSILNYFVRPLIPQGMELFANGDSTEAGLRQALRSDARPILIDESESDSELARVKMEKILIMLRQSSSDTGAQTFRGTVSGDAQAFHIRSMALLSSIGVGLERQQDQERVIVLRLRAKREGAITDVSNWPAIKAELNKIARDETLSARLFARSVGMATTIMASIDVFTEAAAEFFGTAREGDQIGALMAGAWCLTNDAAPTREKALELLKSFDWADFQEDKTEENEDLIATLLARTVSRPGGLRISLGKLIARAAGHEVPGLEVKPALADAELHNYGLKIAGEWLCVHPRNTELLKLMKETKFGTDLRGRLKRIPGTSTAGGGGIRIGEVSTSGLKIPLIEVLGDRPPPEPEMEPAF